MLPWTIAKRLIIKLDLLIVSSVLKVWRRRVGSVRYHSRADERTGAADRGRSHQVWQSSWCADCCSDRRHFTWGAGIQTTSGMWGMMLYSPWVVVMLALELHFRRFPLLRILILFLTLIFYFVFILFCLLVIVCFHFYIVIYLISSFVDLFNSLLFFSQFSVAFLRPFHWLFLFSVISGILFGIKALNC